MGRSTDRRVPLITQKTEVYVNLPAVQDRSHERNLLGITADRDIPPRGDRHPLHKGRFTPAFHQPFLVLRRRSSSPILEALGTGGRTCRDFRHAGSYGTNRNVVRVLEDG
jgi:hypothetical protein